TDLLAPAQVEEILGWGENPEALLDAVERESPTPDVQLSSGVFRAIEAMGPLMSLLPTSSRDLSGLEPLYRHVQQVFQGGEDLELSHAPPEDG
ncbi:MAG TPA: hypothetical protein VGS23_07130, partial [Thermoplasmata archaeon]|nr:hypothetical protein [Thermoplasmata archaeon]